MRLPRGFLAAGVASGVKRRGPDLAVFLSERPAAAAGRFTTNRFRAAPVLMCLDHLARGRARARVIVANSGCANAATGARGLADARRIAREAARLAGAPAEQVLVASTGVIGERLPAGRIVGSLPRALASLGRHGLAPAARAIMTTDTRPKTAAASFSWRGRRALVVGCAKGAGMIHPRMATMLAFAFTDADVPSRLLRRALAAASAATFETISVDGDTSTNDTVLVLANGASGLRVRAGRRVQAWDGAFPRFERALRAVLGSLATQIVRDGEGARRILSIHVTGARSDAAADRVAREVARSSLVKTALAGGDANWGRILAAAGASGVPFDPSAVSVALGGITVARRGAAAPHDPRRLDRLFRRPEVTARISLGRGPGSARILTCDLTEDYVRINADYRS